MEHVSYYVHWHSSYALTEVFPCLFLSCKANARVKLEKTGHGPHSSKLVVVFVLFYVQFVCKCVLYYCHRVATQLQLTNISYHIMFQIGVRAFRALQRSDTNTDLFFSLSLSFLSPVLQCYSATHSVNTAMRRLTTVIRSEKCVVRRFRRCANVIQCTYINLDSTV